MRSERGRPGGRAFLLALGLAGLAAAPASAQLHTLTPSTLDELRSLFHYVDGAPPLLVAHRGGRYPGLPENSLAVFEHTLAHTHAIIETDFRLTRDDRIVMMHDETLDRTTTGGGAVADHTLDQIRALRLLDADGVVTDHHTVSLQEVLDWARDRTVIAVDVKAPMTFERMIQEIVDAGAEARVFIQTYSLEDALKVHQAHPGLMMSTSIRDRAGLEAVKAAGIPLGNIIAHTGSREPEDPALYTELADLGIYTMVGTLGAMDREAAEGNPELYRALIDRGATIISTDRPVEAAEVTASVRNAKTPQDGVFGSTEGR